MSNPLKNVFSTNTPKNSKYITGFVYVGDIEETQMSKAVEGSIIKNPSRKPPWIVVDHSIESIVVSKWPGKLWTVEVIEPAIDEDFKAAGMGGLLPYAKYTRAVSVRVIQEKPLSELFGDNGERVCRVLSTIEELTNSQVIKLAARVSSGLEKFFSAAWEEWLKKVDPNSAHLDLDHRNTLAISGNSSESPINQGFCIIQTQVYKKANELTDGKAILIDEDGDTYLEPTWSKALSAFLCAAMSYGAEGFLLEDQRRVLLSAWESVFTDC